MTDFILHHYPLSPYSEKIRTMFGYAGISWASVTTKEMPPRPLLEPLAGGYRRIPVAQSGADVFCDSRIIAAEIAAHASRPELTHESMSDAERAWVDVVEGTTFFICVMAAGSPALRRKTRETFTFTERARFLLDRARMGLGASVRVPGLFRPEPGLRAHLQRVEEQLERDFLFGDAPGAADFATYHGVWFVRDVGERSIVAQHPATMAWMDRLKAFGHGTSTTMSPEDALAAAREAAPRSVADDARQHAAIGRRVRVAPADYGQVPTEGTLVGATPHRWILRREDPRVGAVHVHFPREKYSLTER